MLQLRIAVFLFSISGIFGKLLTIPASAIVLGRGTENICRLPVTPTNHAYNRRLVPLSARRTIRQRQQSLTLALGDIKYLFRALELHYFIVEP